MQVGLINEFDQTMFQFCFNGLKYKIGNKKLKSSPELLPWNKIDSLIPEFKRATGIGFLWNKLRTCGDDPTSKCEGK